MSDASITTKCKDILNSGIKKKLGMNWAEKKAFNSVFFTILKHPRKHKHLETFLDKFIEDFDISRENGYNITSHILKRQRDK